MFKFQLLLSALNACLAFASGLPSVKVSLLQLPHTTHCAKVHRSHTHLVPSCHSLLAQRAPLHPPPTPLTGCHVSTWQQNLLPLGTATHQTLHHSRAIGGLYRGREGGKGRREEGGEWRGEGEREGGIQKQRRRGEVEERGGGREVKMKKWYST